MRNNEDVRGLIHRRAGQLQGRLCPRPQHPLPTASHEEQVPLLARYLGGRPLRYYERKRRPL